MTQTSSGGNKFDGGKLRMDLIPVEALEEIVAVLTYGASKYADWNWSKGISFSRLIGAVLRHLFAWMRREGTDRESGRSHLAHAAVGIMFLLWHEKHKPHLDDRFNHPTT